MTRGAAISMALLAIIVLALIVLLAWPTHSASSRRLVPTLAGMVDPRASQANIQVTIWRRGWTRAVRPAREVTDSSPKSTIARRPH
jgi:hypothetical protein